MTLRSACALLLLAIHAVAADQFESVRAYIRKQLIQRQVPSVAVAVARDGKIIWEEGFGWADRERRIPSNQHVMYSLASVSKPITATGLMVLRERGKVDLDKPINDYLGTTGLRARLGSASEATVRRVANHTSGLPLHYQFFYEDEPYRAPSFNETIHRYGNLITAPGERYQYSNLGYGVLDHLLARASGQSYADFMRDQVFLPLGMTHTSVGIGPHVDSLQAVRYGSDQLPIPFYDFDHRGGSAIFASVHDLIRFAMFHLRARLPDQKAILTDTSITEMQKVQNKDQTYAIGWQVEDRNGKRVVSHTGGMGGVSTVLTLVPSDKLAIAVVSNASSSLPIDVRREIYTIVAPKVAQPGWQQQRRPAGKFKPPRELVGKWSGKVETYDGDVPFTIEIAKAGDVHGRLGTPLERLVNYVAFRDGYLTGRMLGDLKTGDANRRPYILALTLKLRGNVLNGGVTAISLPGKRVGNALTHWAELKKD